MSEIYRNEAGQLHRTDGPAVIDDDGYKHWYKNGKLHRTDGPAIEFANGGKEWWFEGIKLFNGIEMEISE